MIRRRKTRFFPGEWADILRLVFSGQVSRGGAIAEFETALARYTGTRFAVMTCSGRKGLELLFEAFRLESGDEIIVPAYTLKDLIFLIRSKGFVPRLVDVDPGSFTIDPALLEKSITPRTKVILATHILGVPCDIERVMAIARSRGVKVIEDCAHCLGGSYKGAPLGSFGDAAFFSFETPKPVNCFGGGAVTTNDGALARELRSRVMRLTPAPQILGKITVNCLEHLLIFSPLYPVLLMALMSRVTAGAISRFYLSFHASTRICNAGASNLQALIGLRQLKALDARNESRAVKARALVARLPGRVSAQKSAFDRGRVFYFLVVTLPGVPDIEMIRRRLFFRGIDAGIKGEITDNCAEYAGAGEDFPVSRRLSASNLQIPLYDELTGAQMDTIIRELNRL